MQGGGCQTARQDGSLRGSSPASSPNLGRRTGKYHNTPPRLTTPSNERFPLSPISSSRAWTWVTTAGPHVLHGSAPPWLSQRLSSRDPLSSELRQTRNMPLVLSGSR